LPYARNRSRVLQNFLSIAAISACLLLSACATPTKLAFAKDPTTPPKADDRIFLMTTTLKNTYRTSHQLDLLVVNVEKVGATEKKDRLNFIIDKSAKNETGSADAGNTYYLSMKLEPGGYVIDGLTSFNRTFPTVTSFFAPLHTDLTAAGPGVFYLGHVDATVRERNNDEFKAGASLPLIDQAVGGASGGTFDIEISDQWEADQAIFLARFPALKGVTVSKAIMPPFDRPKAQEWWEKH
jgi:hypothetical protein